MARFGEAERGIASLLSVGRTFQINGELYKIVMCGKPTCNSGEPKTDVYVRAKNNAEREIELKISFKKENADFLENKTTAERAEQLFGSQWMDVVMQATLSIENKFNERPLIYRDSYRKTGKGSITLGWKFELLNKPGGDLSKRINLTPEQVIDVYSGTNLDSDKRNAYVGGQKVHNSGIANCILSVEHLSSAQDIIDNLIPVQHYVRQYPNIYFACKALNYRTFDRKYDGDRPLAVFIKWSVYNGKLSHQYVFNAPLVTRGDSVVECLLRSMQSLGIRTTDDINRQNVADSQIIYWG